MNNYDDLDFLDDSMEELDDKSKSRRQILNELSKYCETEEDNVLPSQALDYNRTVIDSVGKNPSGTSKNDSFNDVDDWYETIAKIKVNKKGWKHIDDGSGKKKKKKKKKGELTDYNEEFETELRLLRNLLMDQNRFTESLQAKYNTMESQKGTARGVTKFTTDLIESITQARSLSMQLVDKTISAKKTIADLTMKEKEKFAKKGEGGDDMAAYASQYLKKMIAERGAINEFSKGEVSIQDYDDQNVEDLFTDIDNSIVGNTDPNSPDYRSPETDKYLKYEQSNVKIYAYINEDDISDYDFVAEDENGDIVEDYPLPLKTKLSVNRSTMIATDVYGEKYKIVWK